MVPDGQANKGISFLEGGIVVSSNSGKMSRTVPASVMSKVTRQMPDAQTQYHEVRGERDTTVGDDYLT